MPGLHIRDLADETLRALKRRARSHRRSLQGEVHVILEQAAHGVAPEQGFPPIALHQVEVGGDASWRRNEIYGDDDGR